MADQEKWDPARLQNEALQRSMEQMPKPRPRTDLDRIEDGARHLAEAAYIAHRLKKGDKVMAFFVLIGGLYVLAFVIAFLFKFIQLMVTGG